MSLYSSPQAVWKANERMRLEVNKVDGFFMNLRAELLQGVRVADFSLLLTVSNYKQSYLQNC